MHDQERHDLARVRNHRVESEMKFSRSGWTVAGLALIFLAGFGGNAPVERKTGRVGTVIGAVARDVSLPLAGWSPYRRGESPSRNISAFPRPGQGRRSSYVRRPWNRRNKERSRRRKSWQLRRTRRRIRGPAGHGEFRNPSDNSLAVGPDHIVQIVNSRMAIFTKKGSRFDTTGRVLYGPVPTNNVFKDFGDARHDQQRRRRRALRPARRPVADRHADLPASSPEENEPPVRQNRASPPI